VIRWIQDRIWLASSIFSAIPALAFLATDYVSAGALALVSGLIFSSAVFFAFVSPQAHLIAQFLGVAAVFVFQVQGLATFALLVAAFFAAALQERVWALINTGLSTLILVAGIWMTPLVEKSFFELFGALDLVAKIIFSVISGIAPLAFFLLGRLIFLTERHVGTEFDQALNFQHRAKNALDLAEQEGRFEIAREITELVIQKNTAVISQAEGALYASKVDASVAPRALERLSVSAREAQAEIRRLYELLNRNKKISPAPPGLGELDELIISYRERGYNVTKRESGHSFRLPEGANFVIYKIIFDSLDNVASHCASGTDVAIDFTWIDPGVQILIKDNGQEVDRRASAALGLIDDTVDIAEDIESVIETIEGATLTGMKERAAIYGGNVEATRVPGVGFTVSVIFPNIRSEIT
jgi:signal transduction histidine kinase